MFKIGDTFENSFVVCDKTHKRFIELTNDRNPLHTNEQFAIARGFKGIVMHGNILNGFLSYFIGECLNIKNVIIHSQEIQYKNAVHLNDELLLYATVNGIYESVNAVEFKFEFRNEDSRIVAKGKIQVGILA